MYVIRYVAQYPIYKLDIEILNSKPYDLEERQTN